MSDTAAQWKIATAGAEAHPLVFATLLKSYYHGSLWAKHVPREVFFARHHAVVERLLAESSLRVAHLADDPAVILGYALVAPPTVHYLYVKPSFRRFGIAKALLDDIARFREHSHHTFALRDLEGKHSLTYNPYRAFA